MILLYILLGVILITVASAIVMLVFGYKKNLILRKLVIVGMAMAIVLATFSFGLGTIYSNQVDALRADYEELTLYHYTVTNSTNEYVRYDYFDKVTAYNTALEGHYTNANNSWTGWLYPTGWDTGLAPVEFYLHGDNYAG